MAVLVGAITFFLPLEPRREQFGVGRHIEVALLVLDAPAIYALVPQQHAVGVYLLQHTQVLFTADFQNGLGIRRELLHPRARIGQHMPLSLLPVIHVAVHKSGANGLGFTALLYDQWTELEGAVDIENAFTVLEAKQPLPIALAEEQLA
ncbi:hypothetical protein D3C76_1003440 [compost metagenome]